jgi:hypothetical protein
MHSEFPQSTQANASHDQTTSDARKKAAIIFQSSTPFHDTRSQDDL